MQERNQEQDDYFTKKKQMLQKVVNDITENTMLTILGLNIVRARWGVKKVRQLKDRSYPNIRV